MRHALALLVLVTFASLTARAGDTEDNTIWVTDVNLDITASPPNYGDMNSCWSIQVPTGSSDFLSVCHVLVNGIPDTSEVALGLPITAIGVSLCIVPAVPGKIPRVGVYYPNLPLDPTGCTPDLTMPIVELLNQVITGLPAKAFYDFETPEGLITPGVTSTVIAAIQLPPSDPGFVQVGGDSSSSIIGSSGFTTDGYSTMTLPFAPADLGISIGQDNSNTTSCLVVARKPHGRLRVARGDATSGNGSDPAKGDRLVQHVLPGDTIRLAFFGNKPGDIFLLALMNPGCTPAIIFPSIITTIADGDGDGTYARLAGIWPNVSGTFNISALWGNLACSPPGVGFTNCVQILSP